MATPDFTVELNSKSFFLVLNDLPEESFDVGITGNPAKGWNIEAQTDTNFYVLVTARGHVRNFSSLDSAMRMIDENMYFSKTIGMQVIITSGGY